MGLGSAAEKFTSGHKMNHCEEGKVKVFYEKIRSSVLKYRNLA